MWNSRALAFVLLALTPVTAVGPSLMAQSGTAQTADPQKPANQPPVPATPTSQTPAPAAEGHAWTGLVDFGVRGTSIDGDSARFERYRDLGDGLFLDRVGARRDTPRWLVEFQGQHVGRRDQRLIANAMSLGRFKAAFMWDQIPMILSRTTRSLFSGIGTGTLAIDDALQTQVQQTPTAIASVFSQFGTPFIRRRAGTSLTVRSSISPARR